MTRSVLTFLSLAAFGVLTAAVLICVGLTGGALVHANDSLAVIDTELTSVGSNADPLTAQVRQVNTSLTSIEAALNPLHGQADTLNGVLTGANQTLTSVDGSVKSILAKAPTIETSLASADSHLASEAQEVGSARATAKVGVLNDQVTSLSGILSPVEADLANIEGNLTLTNDHLHSACQHLAILTLLQLTTPSGAC